MSFIKNQDVRGSLLRVLMEEVKGEILGQFDETLKHAQEQVKIARRAADNKLAKDKCQNGPIIHNFTEYSIPKELSKFMEDGLNNVPEVSVDKEKVSGEVDKEIKLACRNLFTALEGYTPYAISFKGSMDAFIKELIAMAPTNVELVDSLVAMREKYVVMLTTEVGEKQRVGNCSMKKIMNLIPKNTILSPSDKNLGSCLLPPLWYKKEYKSQIQKGGHELQDMSESHCVRLLERRISDFRNGLTEYQASALKGKWPKNVPNKPRVGGAQACA